MRVNDLSAPPTQETVLDGGALNIPRATNTSHSVILVGADGVDSAPTFPHLMPVDIFA